MSSKFLKKTKVSEYSYEKYLLYMENNYQNQYIKKLKKKISMLYNKPNPLSFSARNDSSPSIKNRGSKITFFFLYLIR